MNVSAFESLYPGAAVPAVWVERGLNWGSYAQARPQRL